MDKNITNDFLECGLDEVGRGCLAGPVVAAAVIFPNKYQNDEITDSKKLSSEKRKILVQEIIQNALAYSIQEVSVDEIDRINILNASIKAMHLCIDALPITPHFLRVDGNRFHTYPNIPHQCEIKGDGRFLTISAASILAKEYRDDLMRNLHEEFPAYNWKQNKGYPTPQHKKAILELGTTVWHRKSFKPKPIQLKLDL